MAGWYFDLTFLKSVIPGGPVMKPNAALGMLLTGLSMLLFARTSVPALSVRALVLAAACAEAVVGILVLGETFFGWQLPIDQWLFVEMPGAAESTSPGRMSPPAAFCLVLAGIALALVSRPVPTQTRTSVVAAMGTTVLIVGGLAVVGHIVSFAFGMRFWNYTGLAIHTAAGLFLMGSAFLAWARGRGGLVWALDAAATAGFAVGVVSIVAAAGLTFGFTEELHLDARLVAHSQEVLKEIQELDTSQRDLTLTLGRYLIARDESAIAQRPRIAAAIEEDTDQVRKLTAGNPHQQSRLDELQQLTARRVALSDEIIGRIRTAGGNNRSPLGTEYPAVGAQIDQVLQQLGAEEYDLLQRRLARSESISTQTFLLMPVGTYLCVALLLVGVFSLNSGAIARKRAEEARAESETHFHAVFQAAPDGMIIANLDREIVFANPAAERMFGYAAGALCGRFMESLVPPANRTTLLEDWNRLTRDAGERYVAGTREIDAIRKDGAVFPVELTRSVFDTPGQTQVLGVVRDITERRNTEVTRARLAAIVQSSQDAIIGKDINGIVTSWNAGAAKIFGFSEKEMAGQPITLILPPDRLEEEEKILRRIRAGEEVQHLETVRRTKDGRLIDVSITVSPIRDAAGNVVGASKIARDISERKRAERELRESEQELRTVTDAIPSPIASIDRNRRYLFVNLAYQKWFSMTRAELIGRRWEDVLGAGTQDEIAGYLDRAYGGQRQSFERTVLRPGADTGEKPRTMLANYVPSVGEDGTINGVYIVAHDITEVKRAEERVRHLNRVYAVLSGINNLIVRTSDREELFREACRIAVDHGAFKMAWIGELDPATLEGKVVAWSGGEESYMAKVRLTAREGTPDSERPACRALRLMQPVICNDIEADPTVAQIRDDLLGWGHKSIGCFPLVVDGRAEGVLALFAGEANSFDDEEMRLLRELAGDISFALDHIRKSRQLDYLAYYDELTGLANRTLFRERVSQLVSAAGRDGKKLAVAMLNIERFKTINDILGRQAGDDLLRQMAERAKGVATDPHWLGRLGGDLFAAVLPDVAEAEEAARRFSARYQEVYGAPFVLAGNELRVSAKFGIAVFPSDGTDADALMRNAEAALKKARTSGERYLFYTEQMTEHVAGRLKLENNLRRALENEEFMLHYQPKVSMESGAITGVEALLRWNDPATGLVPPGHFIGLLEETGLILEVGKWALGQAVRDHRHWLELGIPAPRIAVNVSPFQLRQPNFVGLVKEVVASGESGVDLEITESLIMEDVDSNIDKLRELRDMGMTIYIDDFGTGYSSLGYLVKLPIHALKIDRSFVITMLGDPNVMTLVSTIVSLAHSLKMSVVAEGIDEEEQAQQLRAWKCEEGQGYLFSKPVSRDKISVLVARGS